MPNLALFKSELTILWFCQKVMYSFLFVRSSVCEKDLLICRYFYGNFNRADSNQLNIWMTIVPLIRPMLKFMDAIFGPSFYVVSLWRLSRGA